MEYNIPKISNGTYIVKINLKSCMTSDEIDQFNTHLIDISQHDEFFYENNISPICNIKNGTLIYKSETIFPISRNTRKERVLLVFGNPATHSIKYGMFFFSNRKMGRHAIWRKLHDAKLINLVNYSNMKGMSLSEKREKEAKKRKELILAGTASRKYLIGLTTFYSFPTPVLSNYEFSNVAGVMSIFKPILFHINQMEIKRILKYDFTKNATLVFVQKDTHKYFIESDLVTRAKIFKRCIYWPAVSRKKGVSKKGSDLAKMLSRPSQK